MAKRNVVDFRIINLSEEMFQELKDAGQIDPNALYTTPDTTKERLDALEENKQDKGDYATNTALSQGLAQKQDIATAVNYDNITNCITEIPQDIKLEIVDGAVVLKAGSKVYVPNGAGVFNVVTIANDIVRTTNIGGIVFVNSTGTSIYTENLGSVYSGDSAPSSGGLWYDTANNLVKYSTNGQSWSGQYSLPIGIVSTGGGQITSIDQVFNGFGYIGGTIFTLPGVKGLVPNGRNADGTLKSVNVFNATTVKINTPSDGERDIFLSRWSGYTDTPYVGTYIYDAEDNFVKRSSDGLVGGYILAGKFTKTGGQITDFYVRPAFHAVDYSEYKSLDNKVSELNSSISSVDSSAVHKTGNETVAGAKTFTGIIVKKHSDIDETITPSTTVYGIALQAFDKNNKQIGYFRNLSQADGKIGIDMQVTRNVNGTQKYGSIGVFLTEDGTTETSAPTPASTSNGGQIATTAWVRTHTSNVVRLVEEQKPTSENNYTWYRKYSDSWVEQGGIHHRGSAGDKVNLPIAMSNEYYELQLTAVNPTNINRYAYANTYTSTYFTCGTADDQSPNNDGDIRWYVCGYAAN